MKLNWNFLWDEGVQNKTPFMGGYSMDIFCNYTIIEFACIYKEVFF